jgi:hypothetical protein
MGDWHLVVGNIVEEEYCIAYCKHCIRLIL